MNPQKVLDYIKRSGALIAEAEKKAAEQTKKEAAVSALIPTVVDALISHRRIPEQLREKAAESLKDHSKALEILANVVAEKTDEEVNHIGKGQNKTASARKESPYVGAVTVEERESDIVLLQRMGIR